MEDRLPRKLAAILYADVAGYSSLIGEDEDTTYRRFTEHLDELAVAIERNGGSVMHYADDAVLDMFESVVSTLSCATQVQTDLKTCNEGLSNQRTHCNAAAGVVKRAAQALISDSVNPDS